MNKQYTIYIHRNKVNNKAYIGQTCQRVEKRWQNGTHYESCQLFYRAIQKYGWDGFEHIIWATGLTLEEANHMEKLLIAFFDTANPALGYNLRAGGNNSKQARASVLKRCKPVYCVELDRTFESAKQAQDELGASAAHIGECCKGKRKTAGGYHWKYPEGVM